MAGKVGVSSKACSCVASRLAAALTLVGSDFDTSDDSRRGERHVEPQAHGRPNALLTRTPSTSRGCLSRLRLARFIVGGVSGSTIWVRDLTTPYSITVLGDSIIGIAMRAAVFLHLEPLVCISMKGRLVAKIGSSTIPQV